MRAVALLLLLVTGCAAGDPCQTDRDCKGVRICDAKTRLCMEPSAAVGQGGDLRQPVTDEPDLRMPEPDLRSPPDLRQPIDLASPPDLAPPAMACVTTGDCPMGGVIPGGQFCYMNRCYPYLGRQYCGGAVAVNCGKFECCFTERSGFDCKDMTSQESCAGCDKVCPWTTIMGRFGRVPCCPGVGCAVNDDKNCGACGFACPAGQRCVAATCL